MKVVCIGDSNTYGYDPRGFLGSRHARDVRWTGRIHGIEVVNEGRVGSCVPREREHAMYRDMVRDADVAVVMLGTNDILQGYPLRDIVGRMERFVAMLASCVRVLLVAPVSIRMGAWVESERMIEEARELASAYGKLAKELGCAFGDANEWGVELAYDGVHFTMQGHEAFYRGIVKLLEELRNEREVFCGH